MSDDIDINTRVPVSIEVMAHHLQQHENQCGPFTTREVWCEHRLSVGWFCSECGSAVFVGLMPGPLCEHGRRIASLLDGVWPPPWRTGT